MASTALITPAAAAPATAPKSPDATAIPPSAPTPPTGTWRHPQLDDIARRQSATTFSSKNLWAATVSVAFLAMTFYTAPTVQSWFKYAQDSRKLDAWGTDAVYRNLLPQEAEPYLSYALHGVRALIVFNLLYALSPLYLRKDDLSDVPLTPSQRNLLGLGPSSAPETPGSTYVTPPRYSRSTSRSASSSRAATLGSTSYEWSPSGSPIGGSPLAGRGVGSASIWGAGSSPVSGAGSPWVRKAMEGRRLSSGGRLPAGSPLSKELALDESLRVSSMPGTPTPGGRGASVQLNSKWLYQKRKESPTTRSVYN